MSYVIFIYFVSLTNIHQQILWALMVCDFFLSWKKVHNFIINNFVKAKSIKSFEIDFFNKKNFTINDFSKLLVNKPQKFYTAINNF